MNDPVDVREAVKVYRASSGESIRALDGVSLRVRTGEMIALMGPSGCGKSTLLNVIGCVDLPTSGEVFVAGQSTSALNDDALTALRRDQVGTIFQFFNLLPALTIEQNVGLPLMLAKAPRETVLAKSRAALERVGIIEKLRAFPSELSGGQLQRAAIARAIVHAPAIVLADEPTGNLDSKSGAVVLALLRELADGGQTIVVATHSAEAAAVCDRTVHMSDGRIALGVLVP